MRRPTGAAFFARNGRCRLWHADVWRRRCEPSGWVLTAAAAQQVMMPPLLISTLPPMSECSPGRGMANVGLARAAEPRAVVELARCRFAPNIDDGASSV